MGLSPTIWGPQGWHFIHATAATFPNEPTKADKENYSVFFNDLGNILPCELCRENFKEKLKKLPPPLTNSEEMFKWSVDIHNQVNRENNKPELTIEQAKKAFNNNVLSPSNISGTSTMEKLNSLAVVLGGVGVGMFLGGGIAQKKSIMTIGAGISIASIIVLLQIRRDLKHRLLKIN